MFFVEKKDVVIKRIKHMIIPTLLDTFEVASNENPFLNFGILKNKYINVSCKIPRIVLII